MHAGILMIIDWVFSFQFSTTNNYLTRLLDNH